MNTEVCYTARPAPARLDRPVPGQRPAGGRPDPAARDPFGPGFEAMLFNGVLGAAGLALVVPMFVPSRWRTRPAADTADGEFTTAEPEVAEPPTTQLTPIRVTTLSPIPTAPGHDASGRDVP